MRAQVHCAAAPSRQAAWDLVARDLQAPPFNMSREDAFNLGAKLFYQGSGNIASWHACTCGQSSNGCGATNAYMQWLAADDDENIIIRLSNRKDFPPLTVTEEPGAGPDQTIFTFSGGAVAVLRGNGPANRDKLICPYDGPPVVIVLDRSP